MNVERYRKLEGFAFLAAFAACIPAANWLIGNLGTYCVPDGPCVIPVGPRISAPSGVLMIGLALVLRDLVQRRLGKIWAIAAILLGAALSVVVAPPSLVVASGLAFLISELADFAVYTPLQRRGFVLAVVTSSTFGLVLDSIIFLWLAFGDLSFLLGQIVGKAWMVIISIPAIYWLRGRDARMGFQPA